MACELDTGRWSFWIDRGGTFTDVVARTPGGQFVIDKLLSEDPGRYDDAAVAAIRRLTGIAEGPLLPADIRIGTTIATNALLERKGDPVLLAITRGFGDALVIGTQDRPEIFARNIVRAPPLYAEVIEIDERVAYEGEVIVPLDKVAARDAFAAAHARGVRAIAIVLVHGYRHPAHEIALTTIAREIGFAQISVSHEVGALIKLIGRGDTTVADAYLSPGLRRYVSGLEDALGGTQTPLFMQSNGGLAIGSAFRGKDAILSGPAGGIIGMAETATRAGFDRVIGFDMGGTSTDVSLYDGRYERDNEAIIAGVRIRAPMLRIHTVAAGGGSICSFKSGRLQVGPESAGAVPGPASYRRGGPLTVTDCNVLLGKIQPAFFPQVFGPTGDGPLDPYAASARLAAFADEAGLTPEAAAEGLIAITVASMANAIKAISISRGHDVTQFALSSFGGAGGQHACLVAEALGIERVMIHPLAGVLSAYGMGLADRRAMRERTVALPLAETSIGEVDRAAAVLGAEAVAALAAEGVDAATISVTVTALIRSVATESSFEIALGDVALMRAAFDAAFVRRFGYTDRDALVVDALRAEAVSKAGDTSKSLPPLAEVTGPPVATVDAFIRGAQVKMPVFSRAGLAEAAVVDGPALVIDAAGTTMIEPGWQLTVDGNGVLLLERAGAKGVVRLDPSAPVDPVRLEIFSGLFMAIAQEMGAALQHSARSVNIRERLDFSCAIFDSDGALIANAPHIPVHLGSMGESVRTIITRRTTDGRGIHRGDVYALNAPYDGGTHLPDITVIQPVFAGEDRTPDFWVAARGHHADVGGISPGSMPSNSRTIADEGIIFDNFLLVEDGRLRSNAVRALLGAGDWPARNIDQNIADLAAQVAACAKGVAGLRATAAEYGTDVVRAYMRHLQDYAAAAVHLMIPRLSDGRFSYAMDNGAQVTVAVTVDAETLTFDFTGTSGQQPDNFNAPLAVVRAAVLYVLRTLIDDAVPLNEGFLRAVKIIVPEDSMLNPRFPAAVVAGNVETSQVITDALFGAFGAMAAAQGTMNNFTFGNTAHQYYETIAGGSGAGPDFAGTPVVQTHMTNSRLTDPEVLEARFPVIVEAFSIRHGSGGAGTHRGGDGAVRRMRFREAMTANILSNHRGVAPFGLCGGMDGAVGVNRIERADGSVEQLGATGSAEMALGDVFVIETPGGGGFGPPIT